MRSSVRSRASLPPIRPAPRDGADPDETARRLLARMDGDPYEFTYEIERDVAKAFNKRGLAAFERQIRSRFDQAVNESEDEGDYGRRREHSRRYSFMPGFEEIVTGPRREETFLERAEQRWMLGKI